MPLLFFSFNNEVKPMIVILAIIALFCLFVFICIIDYDQKVNKPVRDIIKQFDFIFENETMNFTDKKECYKTLLETDFKRLSSGQTTKVLKTFNHYIEDLGFLFAVKPFILDQYLMLSRSVNSLGSTWINRHDDNKLILLYGNLSKIMCLYVEDQ